MNKQDLRNQLISIYQSNPDKLMEAQDFLDELFWLDASEEQNNYQFVFSLDQFDLSDTAVREYKNLSDDIHIEDEFRVAYARQRMACYEINELTEMRGAHCLALIDGRLYVGCLGHMAGPSIDTQWIGTFTSNEEFMKRLRYLGFYQMGISPADIPAGDILAAWNRE